MTPTNTKSDEEARREDLERTAGGVETRAVGGGTTVRNRRAERRGRRAESRGIYRDLNGGRRVVGQGQVIPDGWERIEAATLEDRIGETPTEQRDPGATTSGGDDGGSGSAAKPKRK